MADDNVEVVFGAQIQGVVAGVNAVKDQIESLNRSVSGITDAFKGVGEALAGLFAAEKLEEFTEHMSAMGEQAIRTSEMLGMSVEKVQELNFASQMVGGGADGAANSLSRLERNMAEAQSGAGKAFEAFQNLGITLDDLKSKSPDQILGMIADSFAGAENGATKTAYAMDLMGRSGAQLIPLLNQGSEGLERMGMVGHDTGSILSDEMAEAFEKTHQAMTVMDASFTGVSVTLFDTFRPAIDAIVGGLTELAQWFNESIKDGGQLRPVIMALAVAFDGLVLGLESGLATVRTTVEAVELALYDLLTLTNTIVTAIKDLFSGLGAAISDALHGRFGDIAADFHKGVEQMKADWALGMQQMGHAATDFANNAVSTWSSLQSKAREMWASLTGGQGSSGGGQSKSQLPPAPTSGGAGGNDGESTEMQIEKSDLTTEEQLAKIALQQKKDLLDVEVSDHAVSKQQELAQEMAFVSENEQIELGAVDKYAALYDKDTAQYAEAQNKKKIISAQAAEQIAKLTAQSAAEQKKEYDSFFQAINAGFSQMVSGILQGTQTWQQAMGRLFDNLVIKFIDDVVLKMVERWAVMEAQKLGITQAFNQIMVALGIESATEAAAGQTAANAAGNAAKVTADGALVFAGVFANLAPILGPAAAGPAAASEAMVMAQIPQASLAVGAWDLGSDMVAQLHAGEMVVPQTFAQGLRDGNDIGGGGGGGDNYTINISAVDSQSVANLFKNNGAALVSAMSAQSRNFSSKLRA